MNDERERSPFAMSLFTARDPRIFLFLYFFSFYSARDRLFITRRRMCEVHRVAALSNRQQGYSLLVSDRAFPRFHVSRCNIHERYAYHARCKSQQVRPIGEERSNLRANDVNQEREREREREKKRGSDQGLSTSEKRRSDATRGEAMNK